MSLADPEAPPGSLPPAATPPWPAQPAPRQETPAIPVAARERTTERQGASLGLAIASGLGAAALALLAAVPLLRPRAGPSAKRKRSAKGRSSR